MPLDQKSTPQRSRTDRRLFDRIPVTGKFRIVANGETQEFTIIDVSVGGLRVRGASANQAVGNILKGSLEIESGDLSVSTEATCQVVALEEVGEIRVRFVVIAEEFVEFLRAMIVREQHGAGYKNDWLVSKPQYLEKKPGRLRLFRKLFRLELLAAALLVGLAILMFSRSSVEQSFWMVKTHEVVAPFPAEVVKLASDFPIDAGDPIASLSVSAISGPAVSVDLPSQVAAQTFSWRFNVGDRVKDGDVLGLLYNAPLSHGHVQAVVGLDSPILSLGVGDVVVFKDSQGNRIEGTVRYLVTRDQASSITDLAPTSLNFNFYHVIEMDTHIQSVFETVIEVDVLATVALPIWHRLQALGS